MDEETFHLQSKADRLLSRRYVEMNICKITLLNRDVGEALWLESPEYAPYQATEEDELSVNLLELSTL